MSKFHHVTRRGITTLVFLLLTLQGGAAQTIGERGGRPNPLFREQTVWNHNDDNLTYHVHGLALTKKGTLLAFSEGRIEPGDHTPHHLLLKRSVDQGATWSDNIFVERSDGSAWGAQGQPERLECWANPTPVVDRTSGRIFIFYALNDGTKDQSHSRVFYKYSDDDGLTWRPEAGTRNRIEVTHLFKNNSYGWTFHLPGPGHGIQLSKQGGVRGKNNGRLLVPVWHRKAVSVTPRGYGVSVIYSDDGGRSWKGGGDAGVGHGANESRLVELSGGRILLNSRGSDPAHTTGNLDTRLARIFSYSNDAGSSFSVPAVRGELNYTAVDSGLIRHQPSPGRDYLILSHPDSTSSRIRMTVSASADEGKSWAFHKLIFEGGGNYSDLVELPDGSIGLLYGKGRPRDDGKMNWDVSFVRFNFSWMID